MAKKGKLEWRADLPQLFSEILLNPQVAILDKPLKIVLSILAEGAKRALELKDEKMMWTFARLALITKDGLNRGDQFISREEIKDYLKKRNK